MESEAAWSGPWSRRASHGVSQPFHGARSRLPTASLLAALLLVCLSSCQAAIGKAGRQPPHIVLILADDMGWNDVGFHGSDEIPTPNIDALAYNGLILNQHYTPSLCTPSRAALLTGKYPIHTGMQHLVILESEPWGLGLGEVLLPEVLSAAGYSSHAVGKWHLGFYRADYTPTRRGFASHYGYWQGFHDYYNHSVKATYEPFDGYDMRRGLETDWSAMGKYSTDLFTEEAVRLISEHDKAVPLFLYLAHLAPHTGNMRDPFQAPDDVIAKFSHIQDPERRVYAAMVSKLDESVGEVVSSLRENGMLDNSIIIFLSDNGAPTHGIHSNRGSNYPLRGMKNSAWEGGNRGVAAVWSPLLKKNQRVANQLMYITDWLPTLSSIAGIDLESVRNLDGVDMWEALSEDKPSPRTEFVYNIDNVESEYTFPYAAVRKNEWKYVTGSSTGERNNAWYGELPEESEIGYDLKSILLSKTGAAISAFIIKEQIKEKIQKASAQNSVVTKKEGRDWRLLTERQMKRLRESAKVVCSQNQTEIPCNPLLEPCLFNVETDPCERVNLASHHLHILADMEQLLARYEEGMVKARNVGGDLRADPTLWNNTWSPWYDELERAEEASRFYETLSGFIYTAAFILLAVGLVAALPWASPSPSLKTRTLSIFTIEGFLSPKSNGSLNQKEKKSPD